MLAGFIVQLAGDAAPFIFLCGGELADETIARSLGNLSLDIFPAQGRNGIGQLGGPFIDAGLEQVLVIAQSSFEFLLLRNLDDDANGPLRFAARSQEKLALQLQPMDRFIRPMDAEFDVEKSSLFGGLVDGFDECAAIRRIDQVLQGFKTGARLRRYSSKKLVMIPKPNHFFAREI